MSGPLCATHGCIRLLALGGSVHHLAGQLPEGMVGLALQRQGQEGGNAEIDEGRVRNGISLPLP